jgi:hypothetical protein
MRKTPSTLLCGTLFSFVLACSSGETLKPPVNEPPDEGGSGGDSSGGGGAAGKPGGGGGGSTGGSGAGGMAAGGSGGNNNPTSLPDAAAPADDGGGSAPTGDAGTGAPPIAGEAPYGCTNCRRLFDGKTLDGWVTVPGAWEIKEGALSSTGKANDIYTKEDIGDARIFFQIKQISGNHKPCTTLFGNRPANPAGARGLGGAQFQPPNGAWWDYGVGGSFNRLTNPNFDVHQWHQCEILIKEAGSFRAACCPVGPTPCKGVEVLQWKGKGKKFPFDLMMHNGGLFDQYKEIWIETNPTYDGFLSQK